ncbi:hypothetical protein BaRGS_00004445 [Batillaria attramentaria]|uniref:Histone H4 n=1 Tax=Batillaria attramentaria TaxID=370345 RepID=A0ABD0LY60_9CAEN
MEERMFAIVTKESVRMMAEAAGYNNLSEDVACILGEDISYRLREVVMKSTGYMKNAKRRRMFPEDFNQALRDSDVQPVFGCGVIADAAPFRQTREGDVHFVEDTDITLNNVVYSSYIPKHLGHASLKAHWMAVEGVQKLSSSAQQTSHGKPTKKLEAEELMQFYNEITKSLVGSNAAAVKLALSDLSTNCCVPALLSYFVNFVANGVKAVSHDISKLTVLMHTVDSLVQNPTAFMEPQPYLNLLVQSVEYCMLEPLAASINPQNDHWILRDYAARLLAAIVRRWNSPVNHLHSSTVATLSEMLHDLSRPFCSLYGAVMGLISLGCREIEEVLLPHLPVLLPHLVASMQDTSRGNSLIRADAHKVHGIILLAAQIVMRKKIKQFQNKHLPGKESDDLHAGSSPGSRQSEAIGGQDVVRLYQQLYEYFGDSLSFTLPIMSLGDVFCGHVSEEVVNLGGQVSEASGEMLLADLMQQVQQEEVERWQQRIFSVAHRHQHAGHSRMRAKQALASGQDEEPVGNLSEREMTFSTHLKSDVSDDSDEEEHTDSFSEQLAVSSTISDPSKGTLKLKISKRQAQQGQASPSQQSTVQPRLTLQINKSWAETDRHRHYRDTHDKHKRKHRQSYKSFHEPESSELVENSDPEEYYSHPMSSLPSQIYSPGGESSGSDSNPHKKGKLTLKLKVLSKESASE